MKRALWLVPALAMFSLVGCAARASYYALGPPPPRPAVYGAVGYAPGPGYVWIDGFWDWHNRYVWVPGKWEVRRAGLVWDPGGWHRGHHGWRRHREGWRREH